MNSFTLPVLRAALLFMVGTLAAEPQGALAYPLNEPIPEGARVSLELPPGKLHFVLGEKMELTFVLRNEGGAAFHYDIGGDYRGTGFPTRYKFTVTDETGHELKKPTHWDMGGISTRPELTPGNSYREKITLQNYVRMDQPGTYLVKVVHGFGWITSAEKSAPVAEASIVVTLPTAVEAERLVREMETSQPPLREAELGAHWNLTAFRFVCHPVYLPALETAAGRGTLSAFEGIHRIVSQEATQAMLRLLTSNKKDVSHAAAMFLSRRMPPRNPEALPASLSFHSPITAEEIAAYRAAWLPEAAAPLRAAGQKLVLSDDVYQAITGAQILQELGEAADGALILKAFKAVLEKSKIRTDPKDNVLDIPAPGVQLTAALAALRKAGYRVPRGGDIAVIYGQLLELADADLPRPQGWEQTLTAFITQPPPMLRQAAIRALPKPPTGKWRDLLKDAFEDADRGVMREACIVAGESKDPFFIDGLAAILRTERHLWVVRAAGEALREIGAAAPAADAWVERLSDELLWYDALQTLAGFLEHPKSGGGGGNTVMPREERLGLRTKWQAFLADPERKRCLAEGRPIPVTEEEARELFAGKYSWSLENGKRWPAEKK